MKKIFLILVFATSVCYTAQAGYVVRGYVNDLSYSDVLNYTLTLRNGAPQAAGSMHYSQAGGAGRNCIFTIDADQSITDATYFLFTGDDFDFEVRDFHYYDDKYVLCGSRKKGSDIHAFVAKIDLSVLPLQMDYMEYQFDADIFNSICVPSNQSLGYYVCGNKGDHGVIASIDRGNLDLTNLYETDEKWEYHKIITKNDVETVNPRIIVSGRSTAYPQVGFTVVDILFTSRVNYYWTQSTEWDSHCVVADNYLDNTKVVMASSYNGTVTLYSVTLSITPTITAYYYSFATTPDTRYCVRDIVMSETNDTPYPHVSVAGFMTHQPVSSPEWAWYGETRLSALTPMDTKTYSRMGDGLYQHYKIKYYGNEVYTGGYFEDDEKKCALFATPGKIAKECEYTGQSGDPYNEPIHYFTFGLTSLNYSPHSIQPFISHSVNFLEEHCGGLKKGEAPEEMRDDNDIGIIAFSDYIFVNNIKININYQIYNVIGQLVQTGTVMSDISTAKLGKGVYILRLESGKTFKFVK